MTTSCGGAVEIAPYGEAAIFPCSGMASGEADAKLSAVPRCPSWSGGYGTRPVLELAGRPRGKGGGCGSPSPLPIGGRVGAGIHCRRTWPPASAAPLSSAGLSRSRLSWPWIGPAPCPWDVPWCVWYPSGLRGDFLPCLPLPLPVLMVRLGGGWIGGVRPLRTRVEGASRLEVSRSLRE